MAVAYIALSSQLHQVYHPFSGYREGRHIPQFRHIDITAMHVGERTSDNDRVMLLDTIPVAGGGIGPGVNKVPHTVQQLQVLSIHGKRIKRRNSMPGKLAGSDLGGIYLRNGGHILHVHIVS
jgi:hypothetical protein